MKNLLGVVDVGMVFVCPKCGKISDRVGSVIVQEIMGSYIVGDDEWMDDEVTTVDEKFYCLECGWEFSDVDDFTCYIKGNVVEPVGIYWLEHTDELREIAKKNSLVVGLV